MERREWYLRSQALIGSDGKMHGNDIETRTRQSIENIQALLAEANCKLENVVKATVWLVDKEDFPGFNKVYSEYFAENSPTRSTVRADLMIPGALIEIEVLAYRK